MTNYQAVFIDWDDTLGDWKGAEKESLQALYEQYHLSEFYDSVEAFEQVYSTYNRSLWDAYGQGQITRQYLHRERFLYPLLHALGLEQAPAAFIDTADRMGDDFLRLTNHFFRLLPDAKEVTRALAEKYPLTLISNGFKEVQYYKLSHSGLIDAFKHILISEEVGINKPQAGIYEYALQLNHISAQHAIMVGDSYSSDIAGAKNAGIDQLWITQQPGEQTATYIVPKLTDVLSIL